MKQALNPTIEICNKLWQWYYVICQQNGSYQTLWQKVKRLLDYIRVGGVFLHTILLKTEGFNN